jgi:hypothetical protein
MTYTYVGRQTFPTIGASSLDVDLSGVDANHGGVLVVFSANPGSNTVWPTVVAPWERIINAPIINVMHAWFLLPQGETLPAELTVSSSQTMHAAVACVFDLGGASKVESTSATQRNSSGTFGTLDDPASSFVIAHVAQRRSVSLTISGTYDVYEGGGIAGGTAGNNLSSRVAVRGMPPAFDDVGWSSPGHEDTSWIAAAFESSAPTYNLTTNIIGEGTVARNPDQAEFEEDAEVVLTPTPDAGWVFSHWSGDGIDGSNVTDNPLTYTMPDEPATVTANFVEAQPLDTPVVTVDAENDPSEPEAEDGSIEFSWEAVSGALNYDVGIADGLNQTEGFTILESGHESLSYEATGLGAGDYTVAVRANP